MEKDDVQVIVIEAIKEYLDNTGVEDQEITPSQRLIGKGGIFDSIGLVHFLVDLEEILEDKYDRGFSLSDERAMSRSTSPFLNPEELTKFILELDAE